MNIVVLVWKLINTRKFGQREMHHLVEELYNWVSYTEVRLDHKLLLYSRW